MKKLCLVFTAVCLTVGITACTAESRGYTKAAVESAIGNMPEASRGDETAADASSEAEHGESSEALESVESTAGLSD